MDIILHRCQKQKRKEQQKAQEQLILDIACIREQALVRKAPCGMPI